MLTLTKASIETKIILKGLAMGISVLLILFLIFKLTAYIKSIFFPTPPPKPTVSFGKIDTPGFPKSSSSKKLTYSIETVSGKIPDLGYEVKVYKMIQYYPDLLGVKKAGEKVSSIGFAGNPIEISNREYEWGNDPQKQGISRNIIVDTVNYNFSINSSFTTNPVVLSAQNIPSVDDSIRLVKQTLLGLSPPDDIDNSKTKTQALAIDKNGQLVSTTSVSQGQIIQVIFFQKDINNLSILYDNPNSSPMTFSIASGEFPGQGQIVSAKYVHQAISGRSATYPIKTSTQAFDELKNGNAYTASYFGNSSNVTIRNVYLAYYISTNLQNYLDPIIVFKGDDGFYAYVDAVTDEWISN